MYDILEAEENAIIVKNSIESKLYNLKTNKFEEMKEFKTLITNEIKYNVFKKIENSEKILIGAKAGEIYLQEGENAIKIGNHLCLITSIDFFENRVYTTDKYNRMRITELTGEIKGYDFDVSVVFNFKNKFLKVKNNFLMEKEQKICEKILKNIWKVKVFENFFVIFDENSAIQFDQDFTIINEMKGVVDVCFVDNFGLAALKNSGEVVNSDGEIIFNINFKTENILNEVLRCQNYIK